MFFRVLLMFVVLLTPLQGFAMGQESQEAEDKLTSSPPRKKTRQAAESSLNGQESQEDSDDFFLSSSSQPSEYDLELNPETANAFSLSAPLDLSTVSHRSTRPRQGQTATSQYSLSASGAKRKRQRGSPLKPKRRSITAIALSPIRNTLAQQKAPDPAFVRRVHQQVLLPLGVNLPPHSADVETRENNALPQSAESPTLEISSLPKVPSDSPQFTSPFVQFNFNDKFVFFSKDLFSPNDLVLTNRGNWITNLMKMEEGHCPIGPDGIVSEEERSELTPRQILRRQFFFQIELQHIDQTERSEIWPMTKTDHMSYVYNFVMENDPQEQNRRTVVYKGLSLKESEIRVKEKPTFFVHSNGLHPKEGPGEINRLDFKRFRTEFWKYLARVIKYAMEKEIDFRLLLKSPGQVAIDPAAPLKSASQ